MTCHAPHLVPVPGPAADFSARLRAALPVLETPRLILRPPVLQDAPAWIAIMVPDAEGNLGGPHDPEGAFTEFAATVGLWLLRGHGLWSVTDKAGALLGFVLVGFEPGDQAPELGWLFLPEARGKGYAAEAAQAVRDHALGAMALPELVSYVARGNPPSHRVARKLGARHDGIIGDPVTGALADIWRYAPEPTEPA